ncbi:ribonuclease H-like domain-containing protein [Tanacetum coccineum]|uniref:Ribonuclease H-like domain-containing protein n=1 Tax=Tanacetum coccineum TaxID=301880 RepID=A0ABQ5GTE6_9ASTR
MPVHNSEHNTPNNSDHDGDIYDFVTRISKLDISDLLHLHHNDTTALTVVSIKLKGIENYQVWSCAMLLALDERIRLVLLKVLVKDLMKMRNQASAFVSNMPYSQTFRRSHQNFNAGPSRPNNVNNNRQGGGSGLNNNRPSGGSGLIPNDDERVDNDLKKGKSDSSSSSESGSNINTADFPVDSGNDADSGNDLLPLRIRRSSRQSVFPKNYNDFVVESKVKYGLEKYVGYSKLNSEIFCFVTQLNKTREPKTYFEASKYSHWIDAVNQEMDALLRNGTWELVDLPEGRKAIRSKWIYKVKFRSSGEIDRYKARLVAQVLDKMKELTMRRLSLLLKKSLYGLKQAPRQWNAKLTSTLIENGFSQSKSDYSLYTKSDKGVFLALLVYVDDIIITGNSVSEIEKFKVFLKSKFMIKDLGKLKYFLGIEVVDTDKGICLNQRKYVLDLLSEYGMLACKPAKTPLMSKLVISNEASDKDPLLENITDYQKLMGKLIYLTNIRPIYFLFCALLKSDYFVDLWSIRVRIILFVSVFYYGVVWFLLLDMVIENISLSRISKLDISDPLHLHPNDTNALTVVSIKLKGTENYQVWSCAMLLALKGKNKIGFIEGSCKRSNEDERSHQNFNDGPSRPNNVNNNRQGGGSGLNNNRPSRGSDLKKSGQNSKKQSVSNNNSVGKSLSSEFTDEQMATLISLIKDIKVRKKYADQYGSNGKIVDSEANQHMNYTDKKLDNVINISHLKIKVGHPNLTEAYISKIGNLRLSNSLTLYDVMVIPKYCVTLISVHKLIKENKVIVAFDENRCYFLNQYLNLKNVLGIGEQCEELYYYNDKGIKSNTSTLRFQCMISQHDWHCRLGHPADPILNVLKDSLNIDKKDNTICCEICQRAKQTREPFPLSDHKSKSLGDLVHLDLWGPYKVTSSEGFRFFLTVVDDYTRAVWVYLIKSKDEYPEIPNDDERVANDLKRGKSDSSSSFESGSNINTTDFLVDSGNDADSGNDFVATQNEEVATLEENVFSEGNLDQNPSSSQGVQNVRRSSRQSVFPKNYNDFVVESKVKYGLEKYVGYSKLNSEIFCFVTQLNKTREPKTYFEASKYSHWIDAMNQEMDALLRNGTWELVDLPEGRKAIGSKWIYKIKFRSSGEIDRYKARLVAQGFGQKEGIDYEETSLLWSKWLLLEEAPRQWNAKLTSTLIENGFSQSKSDYSLYTKSDKGVFLALLVYVDDIIITGNSVSEIEKFKVFLKSKFMIKDLGKLKYFLGIEVVDTDKGICLNQRKYVLGLLSEYGMLAFKPAKTSLMSKLVISNEASDKDPLLENITDYQKLIGKLIYLSNTRPDISYVVHCLSLGVHVTKTSGMLLTAYSDAD